MVGVDRLLVKVSLLSFFGEDLSCDATSWWTRFIFSSIICSIEVRAIFAASVVDAMRTSSAVVFVSVAATLRCSFLKLSYLSVSVRVWADQTAY